MGRGGLAGCGQPGWKDSEMQNGTTTKGDFISLTVFSRFSPILPKVFFFFFLSKFCCRVKLVGKPLKMTAALCACMCSNKESGDGRQDGRTDGRPSHGCEEVGWVALLHLLFLLASLHMCHGVKTVSGTML